MKPKEYNVLSRCVEEGINYGYNRAHKHTDSPTEDQLKDAIYNAVINEICEWFDFDDDKDYEIGTMEEQEYFDVKRNWRNG